nr:MAG TPA: hypothetical protein [Caudoviricetes sp.]
MPRRRIIFACVSVKLFSEANTLLNIFEFTVS